MSEQMTPDEALDAAIVSVWKAAQLRNGDVVFDKAQARKAIRRYAVAELRALDCCWHLTPGDARPCSIQQSIGGEQR